MPLHVAPTHTGAMFAIYDESGQRVRGNYRTREQAERALPQTAWLLRRRARATAIDAEIAAGRSVEEALAAHPPVAPEPRRGNRTRLATLKAWKEQQP